MMRISTEERMNLFRRKREHHEVVRRSMKFSMMEKQIALVLDGLKYLSFENVVHLMGVVNLSECSNTKLCLLFQFIIASKTFFNASSHRMLLVLTEAYNYTIFFAYDCTFPEHMNVVFSTLKDVKGANQTTFVCQNIKIV
ncbi:unnamed protein product [Hymenolepis diminuta]|uniref:Uncharacterized protein n=1 Tax=Hymenolepis diminuta TaxID=6216 RepID=A0A564YBD6_HYMDI|nr:unnamed protein product [Hymenolepis diminuta]